MVVGGLWWDEVAFTGSAHAFSEKKFVCEGGIFWMDEDGKNEWESFCTRGRKGESEQRWWLNIKVATISPTLSSSSSCSFICFPHD